VSEELKIFITKNLKLHIRKAHKYFIPLSFTKEECFKKKNKNK
jgi:hypothetical protein